MARTIYPDRSCFGFVVIPWLDVSGISSIALEGLEVREVFSGEPIGIVDRIIERR